MAHDPQLNTYLRRHTIVVWAFFVMALILLIAGHAASHLGWLPWLLLMLSVILFLFKYAGYDPDADLMSSLVNPTSYDEHEDPL